jgi:hypothetical protein
MTAGRAVDKRLATLLVPALLVIAAIVLLALIVPGEQYSRMLLGGAVGLVVVVGTFIRPVLGV